MSERLDKFILRLHPDFSRSRIEGLVKAGYVTVNGVVAGKAGQKVSEDDEVNVEIPPPVPAVPEPEDIPLDVVFEDDDIIVVNKPAGLVVHPAPGHYAGTLVNALLHHCPKLAGIGGVARPGIVHRLDQDTSGLIVVAKTQPAMDGLARAFASHVNVEKTYLAICHGRPSLDAGRIENLIGRHPVDRKRMAIVERNGKKAITNWQVVSAKDNDSLSLVRCNIETGRTHQIRIHAAKTLGCPIVGDPLYGDRPRDRALRHRPSRTLLHAVELSFLHPKTHRRLTFCAPPPPDLVFVGN